MGFPNFLLTACTLMYPFKKLYSYNLIFMFSNEVALGNDELELFVKAHLKLSATVCVWKFYFVLTPLVNLSVSLRRE